MSLAFTTTDIEPSSTVLAELRFIAPAAEKPRTYTFDPPEVGPRSNASYVARRVPIRDARQIADLVPSDLVFPDRVGETYAVTYNPAQRWFYVPAMAPSEVLLLKCYDSATDGPARFAPHTAFIDPTATPGAALRESIELRTLVFHDA